MIFSNIKRFQNNYPLLPILATIICLSLFLDKAFHIDDPLFIWSARQIHISFLDFYGFSGNWYGYEMPIYEIVKNPPGASYIIAFIGWLFGWSEVYLHTAFLIPAVAAVAGTYYLGKRFCSHPALAALSVLWTPVFLTSSTNVMCDTMMLALWVWSTLFWIQGIKENKQSKLLIAALLIALCTLTKYFGIAIIALLFAYSLMEVRRPGIWLFFLLIPVLILVGYQWGTSSLYGRGLLSDASSYAIEYSWSGFSNFVSKGTVGLAFTGGCIITALFYVPLLWSRRTIGIGFLLMICIMVTLILVGKIHRIPISEEDNISWSFLFQFSVMVVVGISILWLAVTDFLKSKDSGSLLLLLWVVGTFIFASFINWTTNARSILPMVPAVGILLIRRIEQHGKIKPQKNIWHVAWPLIPSLLVAILVCCSDYTWANTARDAASVIRKRYENNAGKVWFQGHWGFQYYMEVAGLRPYDYRNPEDAPGDIIIIPWNNANVGLDPNKKAILVNTLNFENTGTPLRWLTTKNRSLGAGFYSATTGPLPFAIGAVEPEKYFAVSLKSKK